MPPTVQPPAILYKYYPPERLDFFENWQVRFSRPVEMNDAFDSHYLVPSDVPGARKGRMLWRSQIGIFSLTERPDNHLMWVHYAKGHTGFVLGFDARALFFQEDNRVLRNVNYKRGPDVLSQADIDVCFDKSNDWEYEKEWRCVRTFDSKESRMIDVAQSLVREIILGSQMQAWQISKIVWCATELEMLPQTAIKQALPSRTAWNMEIRTRPLIMCPRCEGDGFVAPPA